MTLSKLSLGFIHRYNQLGFPNMVFSHREMLETSIKVSCWIGLSTSSKFSSSKMVLPLRTRSNISLSAFAQSSSEVMDILLESITADLTLRYTRACMAGLSATRSPDSAEGDFVSNGRYVRTDGGRFFGSGGRSLLSPSLEWLESVNCGVCP